MKYRTSYSSGWVDACRILLTEDENHNRRKGLLSSVAGCLYILVFYCLSVHFTPDWFQHIMSGLVGVSLVQLAWCLERYNNPVIID